MAIPVARVHLAMAHAALPGLLPTPPELKKMAPLLSSDVVVLPKQSPQLKPGRADADERWDARKNAAKPAPPTPGRADAVERWDAHKAKSALSTSSSSSSSSSATSHSARPASSSNQKWKTNKQRAVSRAASAERWDARKQPPPVHAKEVDDDDDKSSTGSNEVELDAPPQQKALYAGPGFIVSPEPGMLPMPSFMVRVA
ncbi:hypothetical protein EJB05_29440, partial [Eragrostis curvula]